MHSYTKYFKKEIDQISFIGLLISFLAILLDNLMNDSMYPAWIAYFGYPTMVSSLVLLLLARAKLLSPVNAFLIYIYLFTLNIYLPGFIGDTELRNEILSSFSNLGACMTYLFLTGFLGVGLHVLYLGGINILLCLLLAWYGTIQNKDVFYVDFINIFMFLAVTMVVYIMFRHIDISIRENEKNKQRLKDAETEILRLRVEEENKRNDYLSLIQTVNKDFVGRLNTKLNFILKEEQPDKKEQLILELKRSCNAHHYKTEKTENAHWNRQTDAAFIAVLQNKCPALTRKEQHICSLIRIKLTTKEIADNLNMSVETIKWYRKRIRKKLTIEDDDRLSDFLDQL